MKKRLHSFSGRLTRSVVITVLVTMTIIDELCWHLATPELVLKWREKSI